MAQNTKKDLLVVKNRSFLNKDFDSFRAELLEYARTYFPEKIQDFSEASLGGLFLDLASYVGDVSSFYLDHQFRELDPQTAVERANIERMATAAGVKITGASPAVATVSFTIQVPAEQQGSKFQPQASALPVLLKESTVIADNSIVFNTVQNIDFAEKDEVGTLLATIEIKSTDASGNPSSYLVTRDTTCVSGDRTTESFEIPDAFESFRKISLSNTNVSQILDLRDDEGNTYFEVESLVQDTVYVGSENQTSDNFQVNQSLAIKPAPYRFITTTSTSTGLTTIRFGSGRGDTLDKDIIPDPSDLSLPLYGRTSFNRFSIDPENLLKTRTLGISPRGTNLTVQYRHGGGLSHNVGARAITALGSIAMKFSQSPTSLVERSVRTSVFASNESPAIGGEDAPTLDQIRGLISSARNLQSRIVTKKDLLARVYTMPPEFGRVFRASVRTNPVNPLSSLLYIINRNSNGSLQTSPDTLKKNLASYLNEFRLIADAIDILDAQVVNIGVDFEISVQPNFSKEAVLKSCIQKLITYLNIENFQIEESILLSDLTNLIFNVTGVLSVTNIKIRNITENVGTRTYSNSSYNISANTQKGILFTPPGGIFEVKYLNEDIRGTVS